jgi:hypothetical protein
MQEKNHTRKIRGPDIVSGSRIKEIAESCGSLGRRKKREPVKEARKDDVDGKILGRWWKLEEKISAESALCAGNPGSSRRVDHCAIKHR